MDWPQPTELPTAEELNVIEFFFFVTITMNGGQTRSSWQTIVIGILSKNYIVIGIFGAVGE